jgi:hypothetical protein
LVNDNDEVIYSNPADAPPEDVLMAKIQEISNLLPLQKLRLKRDGLLSKTDWWVLPDRTPTQEQLAYRQALRDITKTYSSLETAVFPEVPKV